MLKISKAQEEELRKAARESFLAELRERFVERDPDLARTLDEEGLDTVVRRAADAAETHGFTNRGPVRMYLDLCMTFGSGFVDDPLYPWAAEAIGDGNPETQMDRAETLFSKALVAIEEINGPDDEYSLAAMRAVADWARKPQEFSAAQLEDTAVAQMRTLHPQKAKHAGDKALHRLFHEAEKACSKLGVKVPRAIMLTTALKFAFGAGCLDDPIYPWIGATLSKFPPDPEARFRRLEQKALTWLDVVMSRQAEG